MSMIALIHSLPGALAQGLIRGIMAIGVSPVISETAVKELGITVPDSMR